MRTIRSISFLVLTGLLSGLSFSCSNRTSDQPNVILIITDDQGYGDLACHGNPWIRTPNLDRLASESCRFTDFHAGTTCAPTRAGLMTGRNCNRVGVWHTVMGRSLLRKDEITLAEIFRENGYSTGMFGKWHLGDNYPYRPHDRGFDMAYYHGGGGIGQVPDYWGNDYFDDVYFRNGEPRQDSGYCTDVWFREALRFIEAHRSEPFFCYLSLNAPHGPFHVPDRFADPYRENPGIVNPSFYGMISNIDENLGILREHLVQWGMDENTILIFMTDNGTSAGVRLDLEQYPEAGYNDGMRGKKGSEYNGGHRVPLFIHWKGGGLGDESEIGTLTAYTDILPTLADLCDFPSPEVNLDGRSLLPLMTKKGEVWPERVIITDTQREHHPVKWKQCAIMTDQWHLVRGQELYDMDADPGQRNDVSAEHPSVVTELRESYEKWWSEISAGFSDLAAIVIDPDRTDTVSLTCHDWHNERLPPWSQVHIREGLEGNGYWVLDVTEKGRYTFLLRRWPMETRLSVNDSLPPLKPVPGGSPVPPGRSLQFLYASLEVAGQTKSKKVKDPAADIRFEFDLEPGEFLVQSWLTDQEGTTRGAYYVYVTETGYL